MEAFCGQAALSCRVLAKLGVGLTWAHPKPLQQASTETGTHKL